MSDFRIFFREKKFLVFSWLWHIRCLALSSTATSWLALSCLVRLSISQSLTFASSPLEDCVRISSTSVVQTSVHRYVTLTLLVSTSTSIISRALCRKTINSLTLGLCVCCVCVGHGGPWLLTLNFVDIFSKLITYLSQAFLQFCIMFLLRST